MKPTKQVLIDARLLIEKPKNWVKVHEALNVHNQSTQFHAPDACKFCAIGAVAKSANPEGSEEWGNFHNATGLLDSITDDMYRGPVWRFNDAQETTHSMILKVFDKAIQKA